MKRILLFTLLSVIISASVFAQCGISHVVVKPNTTLANGDVTSVDISLTMDKRNNGNKFLYITLWDADNFSRVDTTVFPSNAGPNAADINGATANLHPALAIIGVDNFNYPAPVYLISGVNGGYGPDPSKVILVQGAGQPVVSGSGNGPYTYTFTNVPLSTPTPTTIKGLSWSTQANSTNSHVHCVTQTTDMEYNADVFSSGSADCSTNAINFTVSNPASSDAIINSYAIYADNGAGKFTADPSLLVSNSSNPFTIATNSTSKPITGKIPARFSNKNMWVQLVTGNGTAVVNSLPGTNCIVTLPVVFGPFTATRFAQSVLLKWQTYTEQNNKGFYVQRYDAKGWNDIALVFSGAANGNSTSVLNYEYKDAAAAPGASQYRIKQMDINGKVAYSEVRFVKGAEEQSVVKVYPNPSEGAVNIAFEGQSVRDVVISDVSGRIVKQYNNITASLVTVDGLATGFYSIKISNRADGTIKVEKLIIKKR